MPKKQSIDDIGKGKSKTLPSVIVKKRRQYKKLPIVNKQIPKNKVR